MDDIYLPHPDKQFCQNARLNFSRQKRETEGGFSFIPSIKVYNQENSFKIKTDQKLPRVKTAYTFHNFDKIKTILP